MRINRNEFSNNSGIHFTLVYHQNSIIASVEHKAAAKGIQLQPAQNYSVVNQFEINEDLQKYFLRQVS